MPRRDDLHKILIIGSGPIVIGQACEFDYSGVQGCKALREEGYKVVLINSNPATIMTDPEFADQTYIEPLTPAIVHEVIRKERPDALLPTLGGQTALNLTMELHHQGLLESFRVEVIGANPEAIHKAEDRDQFKKTMERIGLRVPKSFSIHSLSAAKDALKKLGGFPLVVRPGFTLGGTGGGIAYNLEELNHIVKQGLHYSPTSEVLLEESIIGWKEFELEVMRDLRDNSIVICSIENLDPMGIHTGDSITVAPAQTLTDREYQKMRNAALDIMREIGVETGGSNVQFALNPETGEMIVIEMNPRVSRSSALASKATGFPIAKIAAKLAVGYCLDELQNDITKETLASFEPTIDYVVTKIPRFTFEKFPDANSTLGTQMKSVGETMGIGRNFKQSLQKALRSLEIGRAGFGSDGKKSFLDNISDEKLIDYLRYPNEHRIFAIHQAFYRQWEIDRVYEITKIDRWFLHHLEELVFFAEEIRSAKTLENLAQDRALFLQAKEFGYSDQQLAYLMQTTEDAVYHCRKDCDIIPVYGLVDTCAAEFTAYTPYYYSTYGGKNESIPNKKKKIMILGGGPNRIGQGIEFDYCCVHASYALKDAGFETIMVNSNPETVSTDYDTSDKLYFEPVTLEDILSIYYHEKCWGVIVQFGGQTPLNLAKDLEKHGVNIIGTKPESIEAVENREYFQKLVQRLDLRQPVSGIATTVDEALAIAREIDYPVLVRPSFVLGGRAMAIAYHESYLRSYIQEAISISQEQPILIDKFLEDALEVDVDCLSDGDRVVIGAIMEHVELAGIHSGDSACIIPHQTLSPQVIDQIRTSCHSLAKALHVVGLMNIQFAVKEETAFILEVNPRASRTIPFASKAIGVPLAKIAALLMAGATLENIGFTEEILPKYYATKESVFPFNRFNGASISLSPEMKSTGEVMGIDENVGISYLKSQVAAGNTLPQKGNVLVSVRKEGRKSIIPLAKRLDSLGFIIYATDGTSTMLRNHGIKSKAIFKIAQGRPNVIDLVSEEDVGWIITITSSGVNPKRDEMSLRTEAIHQGIPITTTISGLKAAISGLEALQTIKRMDVRSLQEYYQCIPQLSLKQNLAESIADD